MPVYNGMATLERAVGSVRGQTLADWELLVVDDGSTDGSREAVAMWAAADFRIRPFRTAENRGPGAARNIGLRAVRGELTAYLDSDDEYYPHHLDQLVRLRDKGDVLVFGYDFIEDDGQCLHPDPLPKGEGTTRPRTWHPEVHGHQLFAVNIVVPLGIAHRREWIDKVGGFNELVNPDEDWDFLRRLARAGARFAFFPLKSGRYHIRRESRCRKPRVLPWQRETLERNWRCGRPIYGERPAGMKAKEVRTVAFASPHCLIDFTSGAAIAAMQSLRFLNSLGFRCRVFCASHIDGPKGTPFDEQLANQKIPHKTADAMIGSYRARMTVTGQGDVPVVVFQSASTHGWWSSEAEAKAFLGAFEMFLDKHRPEVLITYGGSPITKNLTKLAKGRDIPIVFWLCDFGYDDLEPFKTVDYVVVPSEFSRQHYWEKLGLACHVLPNVIDPRRVKAAEPKPTYVTFVNPERNKGVFVFVRIAEQLARRRPDIPILVVEGRSQSQSIQQTGLDLSWAQNLNKMLNTPDPRTFYGLTKLLLMPSLWKESFGLVAAEAMLNGIPVLASDRGALPEIVGDAGFLFRIPDRYTPDASTIPTAQEVEPWVETIIRLWDDPNLYHHWSQAAHLRAERWLPDQLAPTYKQFFSTIFPQPGPPLIPKAIAPGSGH